MGIEDAIMLGQLLLRGVPEIVQLFKDHAAGKKPTESEIQSILDRHRADHEVYEKHRQAAGGGE